MGKEVRREPVGEIQEIAAPSDAPALRGLSTADLIRMARSARERLA